MLVCRVKATRAMESLTRTHVATMLRAFNGFSLFNSRNCRGPSVKKCVVDLEASRQGVQLTSLFFDFFRQKDARRRVRRSMKAVFHLGNEILYVLFLSELTWTQAQLRCKGLAP